MKTVRKRANAFGRTGTIFQYDKIKTGKVIKKMKAVKTAFDKMGMFAGAALLAGAFAGSAQAGQADTFAGFQAGVQAGWEKSRINEVAINTLTLADSNTGLAYGVFAGYDAQFDNLVIGVEAGFSPNGQTLRGTVPGGSLDLNSKWSLDASVRAGFTPTEDLLIYGRLGYAFNRYRIEAFTTGNATPVVAASATDDGLMLGGGAEYAMGENLSLRVEYRYKDLGGSLRANQVLGGVAFRF